MGVESIRRFTCDRCGDMQERPSRHPKWPDKWHQVPKSKTLFCPACHAGFEAFFEVGSVGESKEED